MSDAGTNTAGFQGSETSSVDVTFYRQTGDPITKVSGVSGKEVLTVTGRVRQDDEHAVVGVTTNKTLGPSSGNWSVSLKPSGVADELFKSLNDDDWVDITINRHGRKWHVMRGLIDDIRRRTTVAGTGATSRNYTISGRDFTKVMEQTPLFQDIWAATGESIGGFLANKIFETEVSVEGVAQFIEKGILGYLRAELDSEGRTAWLMPGGMANVAASKAFAETLNFWTAHYNPSGPGLPDGALPRVLTTNHWINPDGVLWPWLTQRADPMFTDVFCDILPQSVISNGFKVDALAKGLAIKDSQMTVVVRDKPFPDLTSRLDGPWFQDLATFIIPRQQVVDIDVGRTGFERFNAFFVSPTIGTSQAKNNDPMLGLLPNWNPEEVDRHGMRRFDVQTNWIPDFDKIGWEKYITTARKYLQDWYAINPYLLNGSLALGLGRPDIHIGQKCRIPGNTGEADQETYYVENVGHTWKFGQGTRTNLGVTRGWIGTDNDLLSRMGELDRGFKSPSLSTTSVSAVADVGFA